MTAAGPIPNSETLTHCPNCGSDAFAETRCSGMARCRECRLYFQTPRPHLSDIIDSYNTGETYASWQPDAERRIAEARHRIGYFAGLQTGKALLDIGCGDGRFMAAAAHAGFDVCGTEVSATAAGLVRDQGMAVHIGEVTRLDLPRAAYNVITLWHVIEHVPYPGKTLQCCVDLLAPGGLLVLAAPNAWHDLYKLYMPGRRPFTMDHRQGSEIHISHFSPPCLKATLRRHGLDVLRFGVDPVHRDRGIIRTVKNAVLQTQARMGWHVGCAMYVVSRKT